MSINFSDAGTRERDITVLLLSQAPTVLLLQELLVYQDKFSAHYMAGLEGCGPSLEADVRSSYYALVERLVSACRSLHEASSSRSETLYLVVVWPPCGLRSCRISSPRFLVECRKRRLNQDSFVLLCFVLFAFSGLCLVFVVCLSLIGLLSCIFQREWHCIA